MAVTLALVFTFAFGFWTGFVAKWMYDNPPSKGVPLVVTETNKVADAYNINTDYGDGRKIVTMLHCVEN